MVNWKEALREPTFIALRSETGSLPGKMVAAETVGGYKVGFLNWVLGYVNECSVAI